VAKRRGTNRGGALFSERVDIGVIGFERHPQPFGRKIQMSPAMTIIMAIAPIMPMEAP
jgi:hypothetical protein